MSFPEPTQSVLYCRVIILPPEPQPAFSHYATMQSPEQTHRALSC